MALCAASIGVALVLVSGVALGANPVIEVRGSARVTAAASSLEGTLIVTGVVTDDTGRPVGGATLSVRAQAADGSDVPLPSPGACPNAPSSGVPSTGTRAAQTLRLDAGGRFCALFVAERTASLRFAFADPRGLVDATELSVAVDHARRGVELRFAPTTTSFDLERESQRLQVSTHVVLPVPGTSAPLPLAVYATGPNGETLVAQGACPVDGATELELPSAKLNGPGPVELVLRFAGTGSLQPAEARRRVLATARVRMELSRAPQAADPADGIALDVALGSVAGAVDGGSVEARLLGQTVGMAPVERGAARLVAQFPRRADSAELELRYLATEPWWRPGEAVRVEVKLLSRTHWVSLGWLSALAAMTSWLVWGLRRPERRPGTPAGVEPKARVAGVHLLRRAEGESGWRGVVRDAHDEAPIAGASVALVSRSPDERVHARVVTDAEGRFELPGATLGEVELAVGAPWHSDFTSRAPAYGDLRVDLVSRRRFVLGRLVRWAERRGPFSRDRPEPTPGDVKRHGHRAKRDEVVDWAEAVEAAAFGAAPVDETMEREVNRREPAERSDPNSGNAKRAH